MNISQTRMKIVNSYSLYDIIYSLYVYIAYIAYIVYIVYLNNYINYLYMTTTNIHDEINDHHIINENQTLNQDPFDFHKLSLSHDYYSITWISLKKSQFIGAKIHGVEVFLLPSDFFWIYINFITFAICLLLTMILLLKESLVDDIYFEATWIMLILRIVIVAFAQNKLLPEFASGYSKLLYSLKHYKEFTHPGFAHFVGLCQMIIASFTLFSILLFVCMAETYITPVTNFGGICVLSELDDWIGELIVSKRLKGSETLKKGERDSIYKSKKGDSNPYEYEANDEYISNDEYLVKDLNLRVSLTNKLALITDEDLEIEVDECLNLNAHWSIVQLEKMIKLIPWSIVLPIITIPASMYMPILSNFIRSYTY